MRLGGRRKDLVMGCVVEEKVSRAGADGGFPTIKNLATWAPIPPRGSAPEQVRQDQAPSNSSPNLPSRQDV